MACTTYAGTKYNYSQVLQLALRAGWPQSLAPTITAIALAESSGYSKALQVCGEHSVGLLQINIDPKLRRSWTESQLYDPIFNLQAGLQLYNGRGNFNDWTTYKTGAYKKYLTGQVQATASTVYDPATYGLPDYSGQPIDLGQIASVDVPFTGDPDTVPYIQMGLAALGVLLFVRVLRG